MAPSHLPGLRLGSRGCERGPDTKHSNLYRHHHLEMGDLSHKSPKTKEARPIRLSHGCLLERQGCLGDATPPTKVPGR